MWLYLTPSRRLEPHTFRSCRQPGRPPRTGAGLGLVAFVKKPYTLALVPQLPVLVLVRNLLLVLVLVLEGELPQL